MQGTKKICRVLGSGSFLSSAAAITSTPSRQLVAPRAFLVRASAWHLPWVEKLHRTAQSCVQSIRQACPAAGCRLSLEVRTACMPILLGARASVSVPRQAQECSLAVVCCSDHPSGSEPCLKRALLAGWVLRALHRYPDRKSVV